MFGALRIIHTIRGSIVVPELEFGRVAVQVLLRAMLVDAFIPRLKIEK